MTKLNDFRSNLNILQLFLSVSLFIYLLVMMQAFSLKSDKETIKNHLQNWCKMKKPNFFKS